MKWIRTVFLTCLVTLSACSENADLSAQGTAAPQLSETPPVQQKIVVFGGTSGVGLETVKLALARGHTVVAAARRPERMSLTDPSLNSVKSDILNADSVAEITKGVDAVVIAIGIPPTRDPVEVFSRGTENVLAAMKQHDIKRLVTVTGIGAGDSRGHGGFFYDRILQPLALKTIYEDKDRSEQLVLASNSDWTIVRPGFLKDEPALNKYRVLLDLNGVTAGDIARADVGHFIVATLEARTHLQETVLLSN